jgi:hypothetical protein
MDNPRTYQKFSYLLRPSKQVERKLFLEVLKSLSRGGLDIDNYTYVGLGSVFYADFVLFHKYLGIKRMICIERDPIPRRMKFNRPYRFVRLLMKPVAEAIPTLPRHTPVLAWLDYEDAPSQEIMSDVAGIIRVVSPDSLVIVTVNADGRGLGLHSGGDSDGRRLKSALADLRGAIGKFASLKREDLAAAKLPKVIAAALKAHMAEQAARRFGVTFTPLFGFSYADGQRMVTVGGVVGNAGTARKLRLAKVLEIPFCRPSQDPVTISVPPLTERERSWITQNMRRGLTAGGLRFELDEELFQSFKTYSRFYPTYVETLT